MLSSLANLRHAALARLRCAPGACNRLLSSEPGGQVIVSIDRSGLGQPAENSHGEAAGAPVQKEAETEMARHIKSLIRVSLAVLPCSKGYCVLPSTQYTEELPVECPSCLSSSAPCPPPAPSSFAAGQSPWRST